MLKKARAAPTARAKTGFVTIARTEEAQQRQESLLETSTGDVTEESSDEEESGVLREEDCRNHPRHQHRPPPPPPHRPWSSRSARSALQQHQHTRLLTAIQRQDWDLVLLFLRTGRWRTSSGCCQNDFAHLRDPHHRDQCRVWATTTMSTTSNVTAAATVRRLPLHAAVVAGAPAAVLACLLDQYHDAIKCVDSSNLLPLELALLIDTTSDAAFLTLLEAWPPALTRAMHHKSAFWHQKEQQQCSSPSLPLLCQTIGGFGEESESLEARYQYLSIIVEQSEISAKKQDDNEWRTIVTEAGLEVGADDQLSSVLAALLHDRHCLREHQEAADELARRNAATKRHERTWWSMSSRGRKDKYHHRQPEAM